VGSPRPETRERLCFFEESFQNMCVCVCVCVCVFSECFCSCRFLCVFVCMCVLRFLCFRGFSGTPLSRRCPADDSAASTMTGSTPLSLPSPFSAEQSSIKRTIVVSFLPTPSAGPLTRPRLRCADPPLAAHCRPPAQLATSGCGLLLPSSLHAAAAPPRPGRYRRLWPVASSCPALYARLWFRQLNKALRRRRRVFCNAEFFWSKSLQKRPGRNGSGGTQLSCCCVCGRAGC
jgi:hypothetical protein